MAWIMVGNFMQVLHFIPLTGIIFCLSFGSFFIARMCYTKHIK